MWANPPCKKAHVINLHGCPLFINSFTFAPNTKRVYEKGPMTKMISPNGEIKKVRNISKWESKGWKLYEPLKP